MGVMSSSVHSPGTALRRACRFPGLSSECKGLTSHQHNIGYVHQDKVEQDKVDQGTKIGTLKKR